MDYTIKALPLNQQWRDDVNHLLRRTGHESLGEYLATIPSEPGFVLFEPDAAVWPWFVHFGHRSSVQPRHWDGVSEALEQARVHPKYNPRDSVIVVTYRGDQDKASVDLYNRRGSQPVAAHRPVLNTAFDPVTEDLIGGYAVPEWVHTSEDWINWLCDFTQEETPSLRRARVIGAAWLMAGCTLVGAEFAERRFRNEEAPNAKRFNQACDAADWYPTANELLAAALVVGGVANCSFRPVSE